MSSAIRDGDLKRLQTLLNSKPQLLTERAPLGNWLHFASRFRSVEIVDYLLSLGLDVNSPDAEGAAPLAYATGAGYFEIVELLVKRGAKLDVSSSIGNPLFAAINGSIHANAGWSPPTGDAPRIVAFLLEQGIDSRACYDMRVGKGVDAVRFAWIMGARDLARMIALWNTGGDEEAAQVALDEADAVTKGKK